MTTDRYQQIIRATIDYATDIELLSNTQTRRLLVDARLLQRDLKQQLRRIDPTSPTRPATKQRRLEQYLEIANRLIDDVYRKLNREHRDFLRETVRMEDAGGRAIINDTLGDQVLRVNIESDQVNLIARQTLAEGLPPEQWFRNKLPNDFKSFLLRGLQTGIAQNETIQQLTSRINRRSEIERRNVEAIVRTTLSGVLNKTRDQLYINNSDVIEGQAHLSTLDVRTTPICRARDGLAWTIPDHKPIGGHGVRWRPFPLHFNERSTWAPVFRNIDDIIGVDTSQWSEGTRATMNGPNKASVNYTQWFAEQSEGRQLQILGREKLRLYKRNNLTMGDLTRVDGSELTIPELVAKIERRGFVPRTPTQDIDNT